MFPVAYAIKSAKTDCTYQQRQTEKLKESLANPLANKYHNSEMDHLFSAFMTRQTSSNSRLKTSSSCGDIPGIYASKKRLVLKQLKPAIFRCSPASSDHTKSKSNSELINIVDEQLMQIRENLAAFRNQDVQFRERIDLLSDSVSELASQSSLSSFTSSECSDLNSLGGASNSEDEELDQANESHPLPTVRVTECMDDFDQPPVRFFNMRRAISDPNSVHIQLPEQTMEAQRRRKYLTEQATDDLYIQYNNPQEISTFF